MVVGSGDSPEMVLPIRDLKNVKALEFDQLDNMIYWIDGKSRTIRRASDDGSKVNVCNIKVIYKLEVYVLLLSGKVSWANFFVRTRCGFLSFQVFQLVKFECNILDIV